MTRFRLVALALLTLAANLPAQAPPVAERLRKDLTFLASPECEGRGPGSAGIDKAADYVAAAFKAAGLKPVMPDGSYFQPFTFLGRPTLRGAQTVELTGPAGRKALAAGDDFQPLGLTGAGYVDAGLVFAGYGITSEAAKYDDYAGLDVAGKIVVVIRRAPRFNATDKPFADEATRQKVASWSTKLANAEEHKAAAVLVVNDASETEDNLTDFLFTAGGDPVKIPAFHVKRSFADALLRATANKSLVQVEEEIDRDLKPQSRPLPGCSAKVSVSVERPTIGIKNVLGMLEGSGPLANETVVIGAHYDHLGMGGPGSLDPTRQPRIHFGADDNASGTTALIELARRFGAMRERQGRRLVFAAFSGEEISLLGSAHYVSKPPVPLEGTSVMINLDMVGRMKTDVATGKGKLEISGVGTAKEFGGLVDGLATKYHLAAAKGESGLGPSDHASFYMKGVPVFFFFTGAHEDYHKPSDTVDRINFTGLATVVDAVEELAAQQATAVRPVYQKTAAPPMMSGHGGGPRLGIMPDYTSEGEGVRIAAVTKGGAAEKGGVKDGDRIVTIAGKPVKNMTAYMEAMKGQKKGQPLEIVVERKGQRVTLTVTPQ